jgi:hypothetical protein
MHAGKKGAHSLISARACDRISARSVTSLRVCKARFWLRRAQPSGSHRLRFEAFMKTGLSKQVCGKESKSAPAILLDQKTTV